jgi:hypothetical protein
MNHPDPVTVPVCPPLPPDPYPAIDLAFLFASTCPANITAALDQALDELSSELQTAL